MIKCNFEWGSSTSLRHVVVDGIIMHGNEVLLNKRGMYNGKPITESGKWGLIGGYVDRDETISGALQREAMEEAGCKIDNLRLFLIIDKPDRPKEDRQNIAFLIVADLVSQENVSTEEVKELKWFNLDNLPPKEEIAFDHGDTLQKYKEFIENSTKEINRFPAKIL